MSTTRDEYLRNSYTTSVSYTVDGVPTGLAKSDVERPPPRMALLDGTLRELLQHTRILVQRANTAVMRLDGPWATSAESARTPEPQSSGALDGLFNTVREIEREVLHISAALDALDRAV